LGLFAGQVTSITTPGGGSRRRAKSGKKRCGRSQKKKRQRRIPSLKKAVYAQRKDVREFWKLGAGWKRTSLELNCPGGPGEGNRSERTL